MATVTKPMALDESFNTTESTPRNIADVLAEGLDNIAEAVSPSTTNFAPDYDDTQTYNTNDKVIYQGLLYVYLEDSITGAWDNTKWQNISVADLTADLLPIESGSATNTKDYIDSKVPTLNDFIKVTYQSGTTDGSGIISKTFAHNVVVLCAWATLANCIVDAYIDGTNDETGATTWKFHCHNASGQDWGNTSVTIRMAYIDYNA